MCKSRTGSANKELIVSTFILSTARPKYSIIKLGRYDFFNMIFKLLLCQLESKIMILDSII